MCHIIIFADILIFNEVNNFRNLTVISLNCLAAVSKLFMNVMTPVHHFKFIKFTKTNCEACKFFDKTYC